MRSVSRTAFSATAALVLAGTGGAIVALTGTSASATGSGTATQAMGLSSSGTGISRLDLSDYTVRNTRTVKGLSGDTKLVGIDVRPADNRYYGVGDQGGVYTIKLGNAQATKVSQLSVALSGTDFGVDFNPAADRLRIISDTGQNLRHDVAGSATIVDGPLTYAAPTPATGLSAAAYTNNDNDASTGTALFDIDSALDQVAQQVPANNGTLILTGKLGRDVDAKGGFDIYSAKQNGRTVSNTAFAVLRAPGETGFALYSVDLLSGATTQVGTATRDVADIAVSQR